MSIALQSSQSVLNSSQLLVIKIGSVLVRGKNALDEVNQIWMDDLARDIAAFKELVKAGSNIDPIVEEINGEVNFYYPITTNTMCLQCHGTPNEQITSTTFNALNKLYPEDKATGYDLDQVRGIWSINFETNSVQ